MKVFVLIKADSADPATINSISIAITELEIELSTTITEEITAPEIAATTLRNLLIERFLDNALSVIIFEIDLEINFVNSTIIDSASIAITEETIASEATAAILRDLSTERLSDSTLIVVTFRFKRALPYF